MPFDSEEKKYLAEIVNGLEGQIRFLRQDMQNMSYTLTNRIGTLEQKYDRLASETAGLRNLGVLNFETGGQLPEVIQGVEPATASTFTDKYVIAPYQEFIRNK